MTTATIAETRQYLTFAIGGEQFGADILRVKEIIQYDFVTRVPQLPPSIRGVINLRGGIVPVVDLGVRFLGGERPVTPSTCIVIVETEHDGKEAVMGVIADAVSEVVAFSPEDIEPAPEFGTAIKTDFLRGLGKVGRGFVLLLDINRVLAYDVLFADEAIAAGAGQLATEGQTEAAEQPAAE